MGYEGRNYLKTFGIYSDWEILAKHDWYKGTGTDLIPKSEKILVLPGTCYGMLGFVTLGVNNMYHVSLVVVSEILLSDDVIHIALKMPVVSHLWQK